MTTVDPAAPQPQPPADADRFSWNDFFGFRFMITPALITIVYVIGAVVITAIAVLIFLGTPVSVSVDGETTSTSGGVLGAILLSVAYFLVAQLFWRIWMELLIIIFRIYGSLRTIEVRGRGM